jgi:ferredoxin-NADP reductase
LWVLEHNRQCDELFSSHPTWDDNRLYHEARKRVIALLQHITYSEYVPALIGKPLTSYSGYSPSVDSSVAAEFAVAAYRYGHSGINSAYWTVRKDGTPHPSGTILLRDSYFNPTYLDTCTIGDIVRGMIYQPESAIDLAMVDDARLFLEGVRLDLAAIDIVRGRDFGVPTYASARWGLGLGRPRSFNDITSDTRAAQLLSSVYSMDIDKVDLWVGGLAEQSLPNGLVGPTFAAIIQQQFENTRDGDRFWYENTDNIGSDGSPYISSALLAEVRKTKYSDIIKRNLGPEGIPPSVFRVPKGVSLAVGAGGETSIPGGAASPTAQPPLPSPQPADTSTAASNASTTSNSSAASSIRSATAGPIKISWLPPTQSENAITLTLEFDGTGWFSMGIGSGMADADIWMMRHTNGLGEIVDTSSSGYVMPSQDGSQDLTLIESKEEGGKTTITFSRALDTGDGDDKVINRGATDTPVIFAWSKTSDAYGFHAQDFTMGQLDLFTSAAEAGDGGFASLEGDNSAYLQAFGYHGLSMFLVWGVFVPSAIFTVRFGKTARMWLAYHRWASMLAATITFPAAGSAIITVGTATQRAHAYVGISLTLTMLVQIVTGSIVRHWMKEKATPPMVYFVNTKRFHKSFGWCLLTLGLVQCYLGVSMLLPNLVNQYWVFVCCICGMFAACILYSEFLISTTDINDVKRKAQAAMQTTSAAMTVSEVRRRLREGAKWVILDGGVFDVGNFMKSHPGGAYFLARVIGTDISSLFYGHEAPDKVVSAHKHSVRAYAILQKNLVGVLLRDEDDPTRSWVDLGPSIDKGPDKWTLVSKRAVTGSMDPTWRLEFSAPRANGIPADQWTISSMGRHMMVILPAPSPGEQGLLASCLRTARLVPSPDPTLLNPWHNAARCYSIVRQDAKSNMIMYIKSYRNGLVSPRVCEIPVGGSCQMEGPHGLGMLEHDASGVVYAIAQGTCMSPFFDLITHMAARNRVVKAVQIMSPRAGLEESEENLSDISSAWGAHSVQQEATPRGLSTKFSESSRDKITNVEVKPSTAYLLSRNKHQARVVPVSGPLKPHKESNLAPVEDQSENSIDSKEETIEFAAVEEVDDMGVEAVGLGQNQTTTSTDSKAPPSRNQAMDSANPSLSVAIPIGQANGSFRPLSSASNGRTPGPMSAMSTGSRRPTGLIQRKAVEIQSSAISEEDNNTTTAVDTGYVQYQHERMKQVKERSRSKPLKLVLLGVFRDTADVFEYDWLQRMSSECQNVEIHLRVKTNSLGGKLPPMFIQDALTPKLITNLRPRSDLHSVIICGNHSFKESMASMLKKTGIPRTRLTLL